MMKNGGKYNKSCLPITSDTDMITRKKIMKWFINDSAVRILSNVNIFKEGVDVPNIDCVIFAEFRRSQIETIQKKLNIKRSTAIKKIHELRKLNYIETSGGGKQPRLYRIHINKIVKIGNPGLYDIINKNSPIKLSRPFEERIIGKKLSIEEVIIRAIKTEVMNHLNLKENAFTIEQEMLMKALKKGYKVTETPSHEKERKYGASRINLLTEGPRYIWSLIKNIW